MNAIAQTAHAALSRSMGANGADEIPGLGPTWACNRYAEPGHNYNTCRDCFGNFMTRMDKIEREKEIHQ